MDNSAMNVVLYGIERVANLNGYDLICEVNTENTNLYSDATTCTGYVVLRSQYGCILGTPLKFTIHLNELHCKGTIYFYNVLGLFTSNNINLYNYSTLENILNFLNNRFRMNKLRKKKIA